MKRLECVRLMFKNGDVAEIDADAIDLLCMEDFKDSYVYKLNEITGTRDGGVVSSVGNIAMVIDCKSIMEAETQHGKNMKDRILKVSDIDTLQVVLWRGYVQEYHLGWIPSIGMSICNPNQITEYTGDKIKLSWNFPEDNRAVEVKKKSSYL